MAKQFDVHYLPYLKVFGPDGKLQAEDTKEGAKARVLVKSWFR